MSDKLMVADACFWLNVAGSTVPLYALSELPITPVIAKANSKCFALLSPESAMQSAFCYEVRMDRLALKFHEVRI
jgi:hypothetical protein